MNILSILGDVVTPFSTTNTINALDGVSIILSDLISIAAVVLIIIGTWKILEKAGEQGWKALIPFYGEYTLFKVFWEKKWFFASLISQIISFISGIVFLATIAFILIVSIGVVTGGAFSLISIPFAADPSVSANVIESYNSASELAGSEINSAFIVAIVSFILIIISSIFRFVLKILLNNKISKSFGKSAGFTVGLVLLPPVFYMILGCGKDKYRKLDTNKNSII